MSRKKSGLWGHLYELHKGPFWPLELLGIEVPDAYRNSELNQVGFQSPFVNFDKKLGVPTMGRGRLNEN